MNNTTYIPVMFQAVNEYSVEDTRFMPVKIWLMHLGKNLNNSYFSKEPVEKAIPSLSNVPILGYIEQKINEDDFSDHRNVLVREDGRYKIKYIGQAYGVIPETNNARFEKRLCDDGIEREFLVCDGLLWKKWDDPIDIMNRDIVKNQSMELSENHEGYFDENGTYHYEKFEFFGACILGFDVEPAMINSTVEVFSMDNVFTEINNKVEQYKNFLSFQSSNDINNNEGGKQMNEVEKLLEKHSISKDILLDFDKDINFETIDVESLTNKINEYFTLMAEQKADQFRNLSREIIYKDRWGDSRVRYWFVDYVDDVVFFEDALDFYNVYAYEYSMSGDNAIVNWDSGVKQKRVFEPWDDGVAVSFQNSNVEAILEDTVGILEAKFKKEKEDIQKDFQSQIKQLNNEVDKLKVENQDLITFKNNKLQEERAEAEQALFERFTDSLTEDELNLIKETSSDFSLEDLEKELFAILGKKTIEISFSQKPKDKNNNIVLDVDVPSDKDNNIPWATLVE